MRCHVSWVNTQDWGDWSRGKRRVNRIRNCKLLPSLTLPPAPPQPCRVVPGAQCPCQCSFGLSLWEFLKFCFYVFLCCGFLVFDCFRLFVPFGHSVRWVAPQFFTCYVFMLFIFLSLSLKFCIFWKQVPKCVIFKYLLSVCGSSFILFTASFTEQI